jgi:hypothetical protein
LPSEPAVRERWLKPLYRGFHRAGLALGGPDHAPAWPPAGPACAP